MKNNVWANIHEITPNKYIHEMIFGTTFSLRLGQQRERKKG